MPDIPVTRASLDLGGHRFLITAERISVAGPVHFEIVLGSDDMLKRNYRLIASGVSKTEAHAAMRTFIDEAEAAKSAINELYNRLMYGAPGGPNA